MQAPSFGISLPAVQTNFVEWFRFLRGKLDSDCFILACVVYWRMWWVSNQVVHGVLENVETDLIEWADHFLVAFQNVRLPKPPCSSLSSSEWVPPPSTHVKMNFNVGFMEKD